MRIVTDKILTISDRQVKRHTQLVVITIAMVASSSRKDMNNNHRDMGNNNRTMDVSSRIKARTIKISILNHRWVEMTLEVRINLAVCADGGIY